MTRGARSTPGGALLAGTLVLGALLLPGGGPAAHADPRADAEREASTLRVKVQELRHRAAIATEDYDEVYDKLGAAVTAHIAAQTALEDAEKVSGQQGDIAGRRVRALYMSGGTASIYAQVLDAESLGEVVQRVREVSLVLGQDTRGQQAADEVVESRLAAQQQLAKAASASTFLQKDVAAKADAVRSLLAEAEALLAAADSKVVALAEAQQQQVDYSYAVQASSSLRAARAAAGNVPEVTTPRAAAALAFARAQLGKPYQWGATGPDTYDCSGLTLKAYRAAGVNLPRTSRQQWFAGPHIELGLIQPGDLLFWADDLSDPGTIHHMSMYAGNGMMIAAPQTGDVVKLQPVYLKGYIGSVRPV